MMERNQTRRIGQGRKRGFRSGVWQKAQVNGKSYSWTWALAGAGSRVGLADLGTRASECRHIP